MLQAQSAWNSLEIIKLLVQVLTPLILLFLGVWINRVARRIEAVQWANQKVVEKRIVIYDKLAPRLNDLHCYFQWIGNWKEQSPVGVIKTKRELDKDVHVYGPLFSPEFKTRYDEFMELCFRTYMDPGTDARLLTAKRSADGDREAASASWDNSWDYLFYHKQEDYDHREKAEYAYHAFMSQFSQELGVGLKPAPSFLSRRGQQR